MRRAGIAALMLSLSAQAAEPAVTVTRADGVYSVQMHAQLDVTPAHADAVFTRYENLPRINPAVEVVQRRGGGADATRLYTQVRVCVAFFCKHLHQVQDMRRAQHDGIYEIDAQVLPGQGELKRGAAHWRIAPCGNGSCLEFSAQLQPDFWVPPLIGPWLIQRKLREEAEVTVQGIERVAHEDAH
ncbi:MAG TPA: SRPBCC family protein [Nevskiaceae bacterium]|nr:SRPBCC family protein [Nevskiaceae bacterium]